MPSPGPRPRPNASSPSGSSGGNFSSGRRGPKSLGDVLNNLFASKGLGQLRAATELHAAWNLAVGEPLCRQTEVGDVRRGVLNVTVAHPALLEELSAFRKAALLTSLRQNLTGTVIHDIRFRVGPIASTTPSTTPEPQARTQTPPSPSSTRPKPQDPGRKGDGAR